MLTTSVEALLFASAKPLSQEQLCTFFSVSEEVMRETIEDIRRRFNAVTSGIHLLEQEGKIQFVTNPDATADVAMFLKKDATSALTKPSLETLTVIAYRGPVTRPELEQIRGVNCGVILRNLLIRGLIEETQSVEKLQPVYTVSMEFMRKMGLTQIEELPDYAAFHAHEAVTELMNNVSEETAV